MYIYMHTYTYRLCRYVCIYIRTHICISICIPTHTDYVDFKMQLVAILKCNTFKSRCILKMQLVAF